MPKNRLHVRKLKRSATASLPRNRAPKDAPKRPGTLGPGVTRRRTTNGRSH